jgi:DNA repair protein RadC
MQQCNAERYTVKTIRVQLSVKDGGQTVHAPGVAAEIAKAIFAELDADQEHIVLLCVNTRNRVNGYKVVSSGCLDQALCDPKVLFRNALLLGASGIILVHNHPGGFPDPSVEDKALTKSIQQGAKLLDIRFLDHLIIAGDGSFSFKGAGLL